ncbi:hypothetical protein HRM2_46930 [Desulforapulum autotrophicum HRM2]|uniref:Integral membrane protein YccS N-terminal domain-containing protein n=1 Tax=Desulforapulum autotrophicum (strain ATCC 43914 / DSM 3382 / VKM B-1955 / HRM2) TaxID=177437 RepID=C0QH90_DESAH|nr:hypothetical protein HRM2_46930 [Desulforapulum autotrophicum HRM2]
MSRFLNKIYVKYIRPKDPGFFIARYAGKAAICCLAAFVTALVAGIEERYLFWWMVGAVCTVLFRTGSTLERRKGYTLILLAVASLSVPAAALAGNHAWLSLGYVFILSFACFFVSSMGVSASTLGIGCLVVSLISISSPTSPYQGVLRSACILSGGGISFLVNFYLWPFDPERVLLSSAKLAVEDMGLFFDSLCVRIKNPRVTDEALAYLSKEAIGSVRRYRSFMESFNIDPLKGSSTRGGPGLFYFALIRLFESIVGLFNHIHFSDNHPEFEVVRDLFHGTATDVSQGFDAFSRIKAGHYDRPDFDRMFLDIERIHEALLNMGAYKRGDEVRDKFLDAWGAVYELKNVVQGLKDMMALANERFRLGKP